MQWTNDHWKNAISVGKLRTMAGSMSLRSLFRCFVGTRDVLPHGKLKGPKISCPYVLSGFADDWRAGMETLPVPIRWSGRCVIRGQGHAFRFGKSWGVLEKKNSFDADGSCG